MLFQKFNLISEKLFLTFTIVIFILSSSCKTIDSNSKSDLSVHVYKSVALISTPPPKDLKEEWSNIIKGIEIKLKDMPFLGRVIGIDYQEKIISTNPKFRSKLRIYTNTLSLTGVSDKEISFAIKEELGVDYFLFLDFLSFPCTKGCSSNKQWLIRFNMVEPKRGDIIFWVRKKYELPEEFVNSENFKELASKLSIEVVDEFAKKFIIPWQILRYNNLSQNSNQDFKSSLKK